MHVCICMYVYNDDPYMRGQPTLAYGDFGINSLYTIEIARIYLGSFKYRDACLNVVQHIRIVNEYPFPRICAMCNQFKLS